MLKQIFSLCAITAWIVFSSCEHQPPIRLAGAPIDTTGTNTGPKCSPDTTYFNEILPIIVGNCAGTGCHDAATKADGIELTSYTLIKSRVTNGLNSKLYREINSGNMPPTGRLSQDIIDKINRWISQGALNNYCSSVCDSTKFAFSADIAPILTNNCNSIYCHGSGSRNFTTYDGIKVFALDGTLMGALNHLVGYKPMPNATNFLTSCELKKIQKWIDNGAPNN